LAKKHLGNEKPSGLVKNYRDCRKTPGVDEKPGGWRKSATPNENKKERGCSVVVFKRGLAFSIRT